jgi:hypothetical protein
VSRASNVRDEIVTELKTRITGYVVDTFIRPHYKREEFELGPRIGVRIGGRDLEVDQGPDRRNVLIEIGVIGYVPLRDTDSEADYRAAEVESCDVFDALMEQIIALWTPNGVLASDYGIANHRFVQIAQVMQFDPQKLYTDGLWLSMIRLTYEDTFDE